MERIWIPVVACETPVRSLMRLRRKSESESVRSTPRAATAPLQHGNTGFNYTEGRA